MVGICLRNVRTIFNEVKPAGVFNYENTQGYSSSYSSITAPSPFNPIAGNALLIISQIF